jgi:hypothetical protein
MTRCRVPVVLGLDRGVGASTVAVALNAYEGADRPTIDGSLAADIVVCSSDASSLQRAEALCGAPVLVIVLIDDRPPPCAGRLREPGAWHAAVTVLPHVPHWAGLRHAPADASALLAQRRTHLPPVLRDYADALHLVVSALIRTGTLRRPEPPQLSRLPTAKAG